jgi:hypothetical protein
MIDLENLTRIVEWSICLAFGDWPDASYKEVSGSVKVAVNKGNESLGIVN